MARSKKHLEGLTADGAEIPPSSTLEAIKAHGVNRSEFIALAIKHELERAA